MCKFTGKIKQIIPFKGEIEKIDSFVGGFIKNYKPPVYDNELPIEWNTVEISNAGNKMYPYAPANRVKISSLVPTIEELEWMKIIRSSGGSEYELIFDSSGTNTEGYNVATFENTAYNIAEYFTIVPKGENIPHGLYWYTNNFSANDVTESGWNYSLYLPVAYDDEFPLEWNSLEVSKLANAKDGPMVKISNLTPTSEEMESIVLTIGNETFTFYKSIVTNQGMRYFYESGDNKFFVDVITNLVGAFPPTETGIYVEDVYYYYGTNVDYTASIVEQPDIPDTPTGIYDDEFPISWNSLAVHNGENLKVTIEELPLVKISNLVPAQEQMESAEVTEIIGSETTTHAFYTSMDMSAFFSTDCKLYGYDDDGNFGVYVFANDEKTERGVYVLDLGSDEFGNLNTDFTLSLAQSATQYLYGHEAEATVSYNGVVLPDIDALVDKEKYKWKFVCYSPVMDGLNRYSLSALSSDLIYDVTDRGTERWTNRTACQLCDYTIIVATPAFDEIMKQEGMTKEDVESLLGMPLGVWTSQRVDFELSAEQFNLYVSDFDELFWSSFDILNTDGSVYLAASDPVKSYPDADVIIDGVGYKGAVLPKLPEWDKTKYPYAYVLLYDDDSGGRLYLSSAPLTYGEYSETQHYMYGTSGDTGILYRLSEGTWEYYKSYVVGSNGIAFGMTPAFLIWANHDVYINDDESKYGELAGTFYLAGTELIPVGEPIGYSYNGTVLPELPEWDKEAYPYALIHTQIDCDDGSLYGAYFRVFADVDYFVSDTDGSLWIRGDAKVSEPSGDAWDSFYEYADYECRIPPSEGWQFRNIYTEYLTWANFKVEYDGTVYCEASEPIPVYDKE